MRVVLLLKMQMQYVNRKFVNQNHHWPKEVKAVSIETVVLRQVRVKTNVCFVNRDDN